ncbi:MAG TPA: hypothetical protein VGB79_01840 [Allosphingosinicella sp.]|jgi:hypothetical protein
MGSMIDLTGRVHGKLIVLAHIGFHGRKAKWEAECTCGGRTFILTEHIKRGMRLSCGACKPRPKRTRQSRPRSDRARLSSIRSGMLRRCANTETRSYSRYGGRGISICAEWRGDPEAFVSWSLANGFRAGLSLDRIDNDGNYEPQNCRWVTISEQQRNRGNTRLDAAKAEHVRWLLHYGEAAPDIAAVLGVPDHAVYAIRNYGAWR